MTKFKIKFLKNRSKPLSAFLKKEWGFIHPEHFGKEIDWDYWDSTKIRIKAEKDGQIVGALSGNTLAGVFHITELMVEHESRDSGVGKHLLSAAEKYAKDNNMHILYLETGEDWKAVKFYLKHGFKKQSLMKKFYEKKNFWVMVKYL